MPPRKETSQLDGQSCPLDGCKQDEFAKALDSFSKAMADGFEKVNKLQAERLKQAVEITQLHDQNERQDKINDRLFEGYRELIKSLGGKVDHDQLANAMETVDRTIIGLRNDFKGTMKNMKNDMKWFIGFSLSGATLVIIVMNYFAK